MPVKNPAALAFLQNRRSRPAKTLVQPVPDRAQLTALLTIAARVPDHGKLEPWRFLVLEKPAMSRLADLAERIARAQGADDERITKGRSQFDQGNLAVVVIASPQPHPKVPAAEQILSAGGLCLGLVNAAEASGWGACWLSGWVSHDTEFTTTGLGLGAQESVAGIIHIGTETSVPPDRPRPDVTRLTQWVVQ